MAKSGKQLKNDAQPDSILLEESYTGESIAPALQALYSELGIEGDGEATVHVSMLAPDGKGIEAGVWRGTPDEYDLEQIAKQHGSGQYRVKIYVRNPDGSKPCRANKVFAWKLSPDDERKRMEASQPKPMQQPEQMPMDALLAGMTKAIVEGIKAVIPAQPQAPSRKEMLEELSLMAAMFKPAAGSGNDFQTTLSQFTKFQEIVKSMTPDRVLTKDGEIDYGAVIMKGLEVFGNAVAAARDGKLQVPAGQLPEMPVAVPVNSAPVVMPPVTQQPTELDEAMLLLKAQLKIAVTMAKSGGDPAAFADSIYELLPDEAINILQNDANWMDKLADVNPDVRQHAEWFGKVRDAILQLEAENSNSSD